MDIDSRFERALNDAKPAVSLNELARALKQDGMSQLDMYRLFDRYREQHHNDTDETKYDAILDTMDYIVGWCSPGARIFDAYLKI